VKPGVSEKLGGGGFTGGISVASVTIDSMGASGGGSRAGDPGGAFRTKLMSPALEGVL
jgi:hypothetical protein